ncbi:Uncharacterised protein [Mycobacteroides abscessus subsp. abscessus]|nr:Uncharacterised protein [Mycobacteroides abscessus subsp. abscessus]
MSPSRCVPMSTRLAPDEKSDALPTLSKLMWSPTVCTASVLSPSRTSPLIRYTPAG